jgi:hypothetical protein
MLSGLGRTEHDKFRAFGFDNNRQVVTLNRRGVSSTTVRTVIVTRARPSV